MSESRLVGTSDTPGSWLLGIRALKGREGQTVRTFVSPLQGEKCFRDAIQGWRPDKPGLTPGYHLSRLRRDTTQKAGGGRQKAKGRDQRSEIRDQKLADDFGGTRICARNAGGVREFQPRTTPWDRSHYVARTLKEFANISRGNDGFGQPLQGCDDVADRFPG